MDYLIIGIVAIVFIALIFIGVPYIKKKNYISEVGMGVINSIVAQVIIMINNAKFPDAELKNKVQLITNIALIATKSVEKTLTFEDNVDKKNVAKIAVETTLKELNVNLTKEHKKLIDIAVDESVKMLPKTNKKIQ